MGKFRFSSHLDDGLFVVLIMAAAVAAAALEAGAMHGALSSMLPSAMAHAKPATPTRLAQASAPPVQVAARGPLGPRPAR